MAATAAASPPASAAAPPPPEASPDSKCPICLDRFSNLAYLERCLHRFCFRCIQEWSRSKAECPLCKQPFASILHSVRAEDDFKEYTLLAPPPPPVAAGNVAATVAMVAAVASAASAARSDRSMRLMLRRRRGGGVAEGGAEPLSPRRRRRRVWEWYLDGNPAPNLDDSEDEEPEEPVERGVIFEGLTALGGHDRASRRLMARLAARRRLQREGGAVRRLREREMLAFRRALYRCGVRVRGVVGGDAAAEGFRLDPAHLGRLRPWLRRELTVLYGGHASLVDVVQRVVEARLARRGLEDSAAAEEELRPFLLARTGHFLHELAGFAASALSLEAYDLAAVYEPPAELALDGRRHRRRSSSSSSSVIAISEGEEGAAPSPGPSDDVIIAAGSPSPAAFWDGEAAAAGPSHSGGEPAEDECLIVGYKKPMAERTPELVQLSSDSEGEGPVAPPTPSLAPPPSTSAAVRDEPDARRWSGSSVCSLSPAPAAAPPTPGEATPIRDEATPTQGQATPTQETRRRCRRKEARERERSGVLGNPNRSIFPAMMLTRRRSPSPPFPSGDDSASSPSSWGRSHVWGRSHRVSPLPPSSPDGSSPSRCSSSPPPPPRTPPASAEKPGGKRKYKSRHLDDGGGAWRASDSRRERRKTGRKAAPAEGGESSSRRPRADRRSRSDRSPSVEIVYEGTVTASDAAQPLTHKRRRKRRRRAPQGRSPVIITLDSDSSRGGASGSSTPLSSQQTVDFSDLPPLPRAPPPLALELPAHILDEDSGRGGVDVVSGDSDLELLAAIIGQLERFDPPDPRALFCPGSGDAPPVLKRASPVRALGRNTPPPLKHKDARSPGSGAGSGTGSSGTGSGTGSSGTGSGTGSSGTRSGTGSGAIPPITALKRHFPRAPADQNQNPPDQNRFPELDLIGSGSAGSPSEPGWFSEGPFLTPKPRPPALAPPTTDSLAPPISDALAPPTSDALAPPTSDGLAPPTSVALAPPTIEALAPPISDALAPPTSDALAPPTSDGLAPPTSAALAPPSSDGLAPPTTDALAPPTSDGLAPPTSVALAPPTIEALALPTSAGLAPPTSAGLAPPTSDGLAPPTSDALAPPTSDALAPPTSAALAPPSTDSLAPPTSAALAPPTSDALAPPTTDALAPPTSDGLALPTTDSLAPPTSAALAPPSTDSLAPPSTDSLAPPTTNSCFNAKNHVINFREAPPLSHAHSYNHAPFYNT